MTGKTAELAKYVAEGAKTLDGVEVSIKRIPEIYGEEFFKDKPELLETKMRLGREFEEATVSDLVAADGVAIGTPTHFGSFASQVKHYLDQLSPSWIKQELVNKPVSVFCSSGGMHAGEELTLMSLMIPLFNLGMIPVGIPYPIQGEGPDFDSGSPYGAIYVSGNNKELGEGDKKVARILGKRLAAMTHVIKCGCENCNDCHLLLKESK